MNYSNDSRGLRMSFNNAKVALAVALAPENATPQQMDQAMAIVEAAVLSQSYLRLEQTLNGTNNQFTFPVLNQGSKNPTEVRLEMQDAFYCSGIRVSLALKSTADPNALIETTWPSPLVFTTTGAAASMETFYNGFFTLTVNKQVLIPQFPLMTFRSVPQTQQTGATNSPQNQFEGKDYAAMQPNAVFIGQKGNLFQITLPAAIVTMNAASNTSVVIIVEIEGVLAQNVTVVS